MAKVTGPLHSLSASGTLGRLMTHQAAGGHHIVRSYAGPSPGRSPAQDAQRLKYSAAIAAWHALTDDQRLSWRAAGAAQHLSPFSAFMRSELTNSSPPPPPPAPTWTVLCHFHFQGG